jgi:hypothetical protein
MTQTSPTEARVTTIDAASLHTIRGGLMRQMLPRFVEEIELGRYVRALLTRSGASAVRIEPHRHTDGRINEHEFDIYEIRVDVAG